ncbi:MAG: hypothetical protein IJI14_15950 [Anaerolineaceae bacterium]|nr:hypothetical protein [Anaerolineaceae bacterium]
MRNKLLPLIVLFFLFTIYSGVSAVDNILNTPDETAISITFSYNAPIPFRIYLPLCYRSGMRLPVLYLLHGQGQSEHLWEELGIIRLLDEMISSGEIQPMIVVMPRETYYYQNMDESEYPESVVNELIPTIDNAFPTIADRNARAIGGISRGALWAQKIAFENLDMFIALGNHSLPNPFFSDYMINKYLKEHQDLSPLNIYIDTGNKDPYAKGSSDFSKQLFQFYLSHTLNVSPGTHDNDYWSEHLKEYLLWYDSVLRTTEK